MTEREDLDRAAVTAWLVDHVDGLVAPTTFTPVSGGHSNLTYLVTDAAGHEFVLRRGPLGRWSGGAHDMSREHRILSTLAGTPVPVPAVLATCDDESVSGASFYVMDRVNGAVVDTPLAADEHLPSRDARRRAGEQVVDVMAALHRLDADAVGLGNTARRDDFLTRQLKRFRGMWEHNATRELPTMTRLADRLAALAPPQRYTGIVHGDYRIGNVMLDAAGTVVAVLDWELWTLGDVLADLGFLLNSWYEPDDPTPLVFMQVPPTVTGDFGGRTDVIQSYSAHTGCDVSPIDYYRGFQYWRMAVIAEGVKRRYETARMATTDVDFAHLDRRVIELADLAERHLAAHAAQRTG